MDGLIVRMRSATNLPLVVYPNSGETWDAAAREWRGTPDAFDPARDVSRWIGLGARWVGGCCRTTPETIAAIRKAVSREPSAVSREQNKGP